MYNLLIISPDYPNLDENYSGCIFVKRQVDELKKRFDNIYVIIPVSIQFRIYRYVMSSPIPKSYTYSNVHVIYLSVLSPLVVHKISRKFDELKYVIQTNIIYNYLKKHNINVNLIHAHFSNPCGVIASLLKKKLCCKSILTVHENSNWFLEEVSSNNPYISYGWENADLLIRVNPVDLAILKRYNQNSLFIGNGFSPEYHDLDKKMCRKLLNIPIDKKILFGMGILSQRKGYHYLIHAILRLQKKYSNILCIIGGDGKEYSHLQKLIDRYNLNKSCKLIGYVPSDLAPIWMNAADLFVSPSSAESFGITYIEALACGTPVIACKNDGSNSIIISNEYGILCEPNDVDLLELAIDRGLNTNWNRDKIITYSKKYTWENVCNKLYDAYCEFFS